MAKQISDKGKYLVKKDCPEKGQTVYFDYVFNEYSSVEDAVQTLSASETLALLNRMSKVDARNTTSVNMQSKNGHLTRPILSAEEKAEGKAERAARSAFFAKAKAKGLSIADIEELLG